MTTRVIRVTIDPAGARSGGKAVEKALGGIDKRAKSSRGSLVAVGKAIAAALVVREVVKAANQYQELSNKLRLVTDGTENLADITDELFVIAQATRSSFEATVDLYSRVARSTTELGVSQRELLEFTEAVNQAIQISGATTQEAAAGVVQFGQALASGRLSGDELRSVLEQMPSLARELAAGLGVSIGKLRELGKEGALTAETVFAAIQSRVPEIEAQFKKITPTLGQAFQVLQNSALFAVAAIDKVTDASDTASAFIIDFAGDVDTFVEAVTGSLDSTEELSDNMITFSVATIIAGSAVQTLIDLLRIIPGFFKDVGQITGGTLAAAGALGVQSMEERLKGIDTTKERFEQAGRIMSEVFADGFDDSTLATSDFFDNFAANIESASERISQVLLPAFREIDDGLSTITDTAAGLKVDLDAAAAAIALERLRKKQAEFIADLKRSNEALEIAAATGAEYGRVLEDLELGVLAGNDEIWQAEAAALLDANRNAMDYAEAKEGLFEQGTENKEFIEQLAIENEALKEAVRSGRELNEVLEEMAIRQRFINDAEGLAEALDLAEANRNLQEQLDEMGDDITDFLRKARENSQDILAGFLADPLADGLDELPGKFAQVLLEMAAQLLASEIFKLLSQLGKDQSGTSAGGILGAIGNFFGGAAHGADVDRGDFGVIGETGPEVFQAPRAGSIVPQQQMAAPEITVPVQIINVRDPSEIPAALQSDESAKAILNMVSTRRTAFNSALGGAA